MDPATDRFIELATQPLAGNAELHLAAAGELRRQLAENTAPPEAIAQAADSLARADRHPRRHWWRMALFLTTLLVSLPVLVHTHLQLRKLAGVRNFISPGSSSPSILDQTKALTPQQKLILHGDTNAKDEPDRWKALWKSDPENPAYLLEYATAHHREHKSLSPEILAAAARLDPENAWYPVIQAAGMAKRAVNKRTPNYYERKRGEKPTYTVTDEEAFAKSLELLHQATTKPRLSSAQTELLKERIKLLPPRKDFASQMPRLVYLSALNYGTLDLRYLADAFSIQAGRFAEANDKAGFQQLVDDWKWLASSTAKDGGLLIDVLVAKAVFTIPLGPFQEAAQSLGLEEEAGKFGALKLHEDTRRERHREQRNDSEQTFLIETKSSVMAGLTLPSISHQLNSPPPITDSDLRPSRYADHALFGRLHALASWLVFGIFAGITGGIGLSRCGAVNRSLSARLQPLFRRGDWAWVIVGGIIAPLLWGAIIYYATPLSAREWGMKISGFLLPGLQLTAITILMLVASTVIASRRLQKCAGFLWQKPRFPMLGNAAVIVTALAIPMIGTLMWLRGGLGFLLFKIGAVLSIGALLWLLVGITCQLLDKPKPASLRRATLGRILMPVWISGMVLMIATAPLHFAEERYWIQQDRLLEITPDAPASSRYEWDVTQQLRKELLEMMR